MTEPERVLRRPRGRAGRRLVGLAGLLLIGLNIAIALSAGGLMIMLAWLWAVPFFGLGWFLWTRFPANAVGPLLAIEGVAALGAGIGLAYGAYSWIPARLAPAAAPIIFTNVAQAPAAYLLVIALLRFPNGRLVTHRWRKVELAIYLLLALSILLGFLAAPGHGLNHPFVGADTALAAADLLPQLFIGFPLSLMAVATALTLRFRAGDPVVRLQLKWLLFAVLIYLGFQTIGQITALIGGRETWSEWGAVVDGGFASLIPFAIAAAVVRYRLYEIDRIISRTLSYTIVAVVVAVVYAAPVIFLPTVVGGTSDLVVAIATLTAAAAFNPVRRRIQAAIDRRFNRAKYDTEREIGLIGTRIRDQIATDDLIHDVSAALDRTLRPTSTTIWIKEYGL